ncbi:MAG TPA: hypothetical protein VMA33_05285, partial [Candidatus Tectomicrobia bacterium]|nr:hypothetical protein [Candidatus Tectomicrobia bacterium]
MLPFGRLWYDTPDNAIGNAKHRSRSHDAVIRVYDTAGNVIETHEHKGREDATTSLLAREPAAAAAASGRRAALL